MIKTSLSITTLCTFLPLTLLGCQSKILSNPPPTVITHPEFKKSLDINKPNLSSPLVVMPSVLTKEGYRIAPMAKLTGPLNLKDNCLMIGDQAVVFPAETTSWDAQNQILTIRKTKYRLGDTMSVGGGEYSYAALQPQPKINCKVEKVWLM